MKGLWLDLEGGNFDVSPKAHFALSKLRNVYVAASIYIEPHDSINMKYHAKP